jgi:hypothetical protein
MSGMKSRHYGNKTGIKERTLADYLYAARVYEKVLHVQNFSPAS